MEAHRVYMRMFPSQGMQHLQKRSFVAMGSVFMIR